MVHYLSNIHIIFKISRISKIFRTSLDIVSEQNLDLLDENRLMSVFLVVGPESCGKTMLLNRLVGNPFSPEYVPSVSLTHYIKSITVEQNNNKNYITFVMWDASGDLKYRSLVQEKYEEADVILFAYDVSEFGSFDAAEQQLNDYLAFKNQKKALLYFIGLKSDLRQSSNQRSEKVMIGDREINHIWFSSLNYNDEDKKVFKDIALEILKQKAGQCVVEARKRRVCCEK